VAKPYIFLSPFSSGKLLHKRWPYYKELIELLKLEYPQYEMVVAPGPSEIENAKLLNVNVILDGEKALIVRIGLTETVFGVTKSGGEWDGDYVWRYVPNERIPFLKIEKIVFDKTPEKNGEHAVINREMILQNRAIIEELVTEAINAPKAKNSK